MGGGGVTSYSAGRLRSREYPALLSSHSGSVLCCCFIKCGIFELWCVYEYTVLDLLADCYDFVVVVVDDDNAQHRKLVVCYGL